ncbi:ankyrin repeat domain-containing protein [Listeria booriae]|uniref:ankyrin repeat domain-containing protein n=1 Tax=Listeria booriae TaxID=1552123 RepID=UPI0016298E93|nr:ankyrin repeat domain-containing protein [Listeria booriae]MBC2369339.1 ankyrin repeat domain-containing protein [Listeria booriae]
MNLYRDLSYYSDQHYENAKNIGWCKSDNHFGKSSNMDKDLIRNLWEFIKRPVNKTRGGMRIESVEYNNEKLNLGFSEIRVLDSNGGRYAAPDLLFHSIINGNYQPPQCFIDAVMDGPKPGTKVYEDYLSRYRQEMLWGESEEVIKISNRLTSCVLNGDMDGLFGFLDNSTEYNNSKSFIDIITENGSLLNTAIIAGKTDIARKLIEKGINIDKFSGSELNSAIDNNETEIVELLLIKGIFINVASMSTNPLFKAIVSNNIEVVELLLNHGIDVSTSYSNEFVRDMTALDMAKKYNNTKILKLLEA